MSWDVDEVEFYETFAEIAADPARGLEDAKRWAWSALRWTQQENRKLRHVLAWVEEGIAEGERRERATVVAYLRQQANAEHPIERGVPSLSPAGRGLLLLHADLIERGEHRTKEEK